MHPDTAGRNRHPVDRLHDIRTALKTLEAEEKEAAAEVSKLMGSNDSVGGVEYIASQSISERKGSIDDKKLAAAGIDPDKFRKAPSVVAKITLAKRADADAL